MLGEEGWEALRAVWGEDREGSTGQETSKKVVVMLVVGAGSGGNGGGGG